MTISISFGAHPAWRDWRGGAYRRAGSNAAATAVIHLANAGVEQDRFAGKADQVALDGEEGVAGESDVSVRKDCGEGLEFIERCGRK